MSPSFTGWSVLFLVLCACGSPARVCDLTVCPAGCCDAAGVCLGGTAACSPGAGGGGGTNGGTAGGATGGGTSTGGTCVAPVFTVSGSLPTPGGTLNAYDGLVASVVQHKRDVDPVEDGCVANVELTLRAAGQCELKVTAGGKKLSDGALVVKTVELNANSQCPGFLDAQEGVYENTGGLTTGELLLTTPTAPGRNVAQSCLSTQLTLKLAGTLNRKTDAAPLVLTASQLVISGQFSSSGDVALRCPEACTGDCLLRPYWVDPATNLKWEHPARFALPSKKGSWAAAYAYCDALTVGGVAPGAWRMPSIDELRTLVRNRAAVQPGGSCKVCSACAAPCVASTCDTGCNGGAGSSSCLFAPPELGSDCTNPFDQWSSTEVSNHPGSHWSLTFYSASLYTVATEGGVRCVR